MQIGNDKAANNNQIRKCPGNWRSAGGGLQAGWIRARIVPWSSNGIDRPAGRTRARTN